MFTGGVKFYTSVVFKKKKRKKKKKETAVVVACVIFIPGFSPCGVSILFTPGIIPTFAR